MTHQPLTATETDRATARGPSFEAMHCARRDLCLLSQPNLQRSVRTQRFQFFESTLLCVLSGRMILDSGRHHIELNTAAPLALVDQHTTADIAKEPGEEALPFRSIFLTFSPELLADFHRDVLPPQASTSRPAPFATAHLDNDLLTTLNHCIQSVRDPHISDQRIRYRLLDLLAALAERGLHFAQPAPGDSTTARLRKLISEAPGAHWTAHTASHALATSEATLRRRLAAEQSRFEDLLLDVRLHHGMLLLQTTQWSIPHIAEACGYRSRTRFSTRFHERFGCSPSAVR